jgi:hypothetical protein
VFGSENCQLDVNDTHEASLEDDTGGEYEYDYGADAEGLYAADGPEAYVEPYVGSYAAPSSYQAPARHAQRHSAPSHTRSVSRTSTDAGYSQHTTTAYPTRTASRWTNPAPVPASTALYHEAAAGAEYYSDDYSTQPTDQYYEDGAYPNEQGGYYDEQGSYDDDHSESGSHYGTRDTSYVHAVAGSKYDAYIPNDRNSRKVSGGSNGDGHGQGKAPATSKYDVFIPGDSVESTGIARHDYSGRGDRQNKYDSDGSRSAQRDSRATAAGSKYDTYIPDYERSSRSGRGGRGGRRTAASKYDVYIHGQSVGERDPSALPLHEAPESLAPAKNEKCGSTPAAVASRPDSPEAAKTSSSSKPTVSAKLRLAQQPHTSHSDSRPQAPGGAVIRGKGKYSNRESSSAASQMPTAQEQVVTAKPVVPPPAGPATAVLETGIDKNFIESVSERAKALKTCISSPSEKHQQAEAAGQTGRMETPPKAAEWNGGEKAPSVHLSVAERKLTTVYFKMLKLGIPPQSILQKMSLDGLPIDLSRRVMLEMGSAHHLPSGDSQEKIHQDVMRDAALSSKKKLLRLHWKPLNTSHLSASSLWSNALGEELGVEPDSEEMCEIERLFGVAAPKMIPGASSSKAASKASKSNMSHIPVVLDMQRSTNISIGLAYYKDVGSMRCILNAVCSLNSMKKRLTVDRLLNLSVMLPHVVEAKALQGVETANKAEMFCKLAMEYYPHLAGRLSCFLTMSQFADIQQSVIPKMHIYVKALDDIMQSKRLALILNKMLHIGNALNAGTAIGSAVGFSLPSLAYAMTLRGGEDKKTSVLDFAVRSLRQKGHTDILQVVEDIKLVEEMHHLSTSSIANDASEAEREYEDLLDQLKVAEDYMLFYYQGALERWRQFESGTPLAVKEEDLVDTPFGPGTIKEVRPNGILKVRPLKWHLTNEVSHAMFVHKSSVSIRAPFVAGDVVDTHHGAGVVVEVRPEDSVAVIRPMTWSLSAMSTPLIYEPIVGLRPQHDPVRLDAIPSSESDMPKLTQSFVSVLKAFIKTSSEKIKDMKRLKELMMRRVVDIGHYFGESEDTFNIAEMVEVLRKFRSALMPLYEVELRVAAAEKMREERKRIAAEKAALAAAEKEKFFAPKVITKPIATEPTFAPGPSKFVNVMAGNSSSDSDSDGKDDGEDDGAYGRFSPSSDIGDDSDSYEKWLRQFYADMSSHSNADPSITSGKRMACCDIYALFLIVDCAYCLYVCRCGHVLTDCGDRT